MKYIHKIVITLLLVVGLSTASATDIPFMTIESPQQFVSSERQLALQENKKLLWVLGANWCHDSRSLQEKFALTEMASLLESDYRLAMIDVGYLEQGFEFTEIVGMQTFYATPTVLIIEPNSMRQINTKDMHIWSHAETVSEADTLAYFTRYRDTVLETKPAYTNEQMQLLDQLNNFVAVQEQRILHSYKVVGPLLQAYKEQNADEHFQSYWAALADLRMELPKVITANMAIINSLEEGDVKQLQLPELKAFPWE